MSISIMNDIDWDELQVFYHVATSGGLTGAAGKTGLSAPTLGRRMLALEQKTGQALFQRAQTGYGLTPAGEALLKRVRVMHAAAQPIEDLLRGGRARHTVRLSAGTATTTFLVDRFSDLSKPQDDFRLHFMSSEAIFDLTHREIDLGIRNKPAESGNLASRKLGLLRFAPYRCWTETQPDLLNWVAIDAQHARHPAAHWMLGQDLPICAYTSSAATMHALVRAGAGIGVMPCLMADNDPALVRAGPIIEELTETQYLVMHSDDRHQSHMRTVIERIVAIYRDNAPLLAGERPMRG